MKRRVMIAVMAMVLCLGTVLVSPGGYVSADSEVAETDMPTGELEYITLQENTAFRWNANGEALKSNEIHLDDNEGMNCSFRFDKVEDGWYGIKHIKSGGTDLFADIEDKSKDEGKVLHLWESNDNKVKGNEHRQFAFYPAGIDSNGNQSYYIKNRNSGLWMGYEDTDRNGKPSYGDKIIQTKESNRKAWIITPAVIPKSGDEVEDLIKTEEGRAYCEIFKPGTIEALNRNGDEVFDGSAIHMYTMGTSSKWAIEWEDKYKAYKIYALTDGEADLGSGKVWDVNGQSGDENELIHLWSNNSNDQNRNTSNLWRFIRQQDGSYKIQSARTGKFAHDGQIDSNGQSLPWLSQTSDGTAFEVEFFASDGDKISYNYSEDWMAQLPDDAVLSSVNLPGSHDAGTAAIVEDGIPQISFTSCQKYYYEEQLNVGVRSFDIRCNALSDDAALSDVIIIHGNERWHCSNRDATDLTLDNILNESVRFLDEHPTETIVMMVKPDDGSTIGLVKAVASFIKAEVAKGDECHVWTGNEIPSVKEARGKIVFLRRYEIDKSKYDPAADGLQERWFGIDLSKWDDHSYGDTKYAIKIYGQDQYGTAVYAQDAYSENANGKIEYIEGTMAQTTGADTTHAIPADSWIFNYTSCSKWIPLNVTRDLNPQLFADEFGKDKSGYIDNRRLGMVMLNFVDRPMSRLIYETNLKDNDFLTAKAVFPESITLSQGERLSDAKLAGQLGGGRWVFEKGDYVPTLEDFKSGRTFRLRFIPDDDRLQGVEKDVTITSFEQKTPAGQNAADKKGSVSGANTSDNTDMAALAAAAMIAFLALLGAVAAVKLRKEH